MHRLQESIEEKKITKARKEEKAAQNKKDLWNYISYHPDQNYVEKDFSSIKKIINEANNYFKDQLRASSEAQKYIDKRSIDEDIIQKFELGYSGNGNNNLYNHLKKIGLNIDDAISIGLIKKSNKKRNCTTPRLDKNHSLQLML